jgi:RNA recognition motif-containing protein
MASRGVASVADRDLAGSRSTMAKMPLALNIYVGNLSFNVTEADLKELFGQHGTVQTASVIKDKYSGESRGFGFVEMPEKEEALKAISALNGKDLNPLRGSPRT